MTTQSYDSVLDLVKERLEQIDKIKNKFSGFPEVQEKLKNAKDLFHINIKLCVFQTFGLKMTYIRFLAI